MTQPDLRSNSRQQVTLRLSPSVQTAIQSVGNSATTAISIVRELQSLHPEYAAGKARRMQLVERSESQKQHAHDWLQDVRALYNEDSVPQLHGRSVIYGLALLDPSLSQQLLTNEFLPDLQKEIEDHQQGASITSLFTDQGKQLYAVLHSNGMGPNGAVPTHVDLPAKLDQLGRKAFAEALAIRIRRVHAEGHSSARRQEVDPEEAGSFMLHVHGPWGAGKTSLLNFLRDQLTTGVPNTNPKSEEGRWIVVDFNAWQHQRIGPPWWWLMNAVFRQAIRQLWQMDRRRAIKVWIMEYLWRIKTAGWIPYLLAACLLYWSFSVTNGFHLFDASGYGNSTSRAGSSPNPSPPLASPGTNAKAFNDMLALITTLWGLFLAMSRSLLPGSARGAQGFMETTRDPMKVLTEHFSAMVRRINYPVAVFIDDLDRCQSSFVVDLLEGIQTMFRRAPVTYIVASDRRWLQASFDSAYALFAGKLEEVGRPLSYLFMDKIFQLSTSVPQLSQEMKANYWRSLVLGETPFKDGKQQEQAREAVRQQLKRFTNEHDMLLAVQQETDVVKNQLLREEAIKLLATPVAQQQTYHLLLPFSALLEPNPRAMKRLVNAYSVHRDINILAGVRVDMTALARWTILNLRWPLIADYLSQCVSDAPDNASIQLADVPENISQLLNSTDVYRVIWDAQYGLPLDVKNIRDCISLRPERLAGETVA